MGEECPTAEKLGALIDGGLSSAERERIVLHLDHCDACFHTFTTAVEFLEQHRPVTLEPPSGSED